MAGTVFSTSQPPVIGVLLPVRLETRFFHNAKIKQWQMKVRIVPDDVCFDRHDPRHSAEEQAAITAFWDACENDLDRAVQSGLWRSFVTRHGGARAAWLVQTFPPDAADKPDPSQLRDGPLFSTLRGLPDEIHLWAAFKNQPLQLLATLAVDKAKLETVDLPDPDSKEKRWWNSFALAKALGLAAEIDLGSQAPDNIEMLYAVGLGDEPPDALFKAHAARGSLALLAPGTPTNTLEGEPAAPLDANPEHWLDVARNAHANAPGTTAVSEALTGDRHALGTLLGGDADPRAAGNALVQALWPALWGHPFKDLWGVGGAVHQAGLWAGDNLLPEGPLPAIRVGQQPYGLLPATSLALLKSDDKNPPVEAHLRDSLLRLRAAWAESARGAGNVADSDTEKLLRLLGRTASSTGYAWRWFLPLESFVWLYWAYDGGAPFDTLVQWWTDLLAEPLSYPLDPQRRYAAFGWPQDLKIPLVEPEPLAEGETFGSVLKAAVNELLGRLEEGQGPLVEVLPNSLLIRLLLHAIVVASAEVTRSRQDNFDPVLEPLCKPPDAPTRLRQDARPVGGPPTGPLPAETLYNRVLAAVAVIAATPVAELERAFRAVLDTAAYRVDPWITACATRRMERFRTENPVYALGLYGWVDSPFTGKPGPTAGGLLHAPSEAQCYTALVLRDKAIHDPEASRWRMNLDSRSVRIADRLADGVRAGHDLQELLGREVERVVETPAAIAALRSSFPIRPEHQGRRPCNGQAVLDANPLTLNLPSTTLSALVPLRQALDAYGDLLVAEAVHHVVEGRAAIAGAAMDAAAGLSAPPSLEVLRTPRTGRSVTSTVLFCLTPAADPPAGDIKISPVEIADPAVAAWLAAATDPDPRHWRWSVTRADGSTIGVDLAALAFKPFDTVVLSSDALHGLVLAAAGGGEIAAGAEGDVLHERLRRLIGALGGRPALPEDVTNPAQAPDPAPVAAELRNRLTRLLDAADLLRQTLANAATDGARQDALWAASRWGIGAWDKAGLALDDRVAGALAALDARLDAAPENPAALAAEDLAKAIAEVATEDGHYPVSGRLDLADLGLVADVRPPGAGLNPIDEQWLSVAAVVRPPLARLEAWQLERLVETGRGPFFAWSNRPGDPWQLNVPVNPETGLRPDSALFVAYGPPGVLDGMPGVLSVILLDGWTEMVPSTEQATCAGFGFNAPGARAPQAVLIAVPPRGDGELDKDALIRILAETRELAHARMAGADELGAFAGAVPTIMLPAVGDTGVDLLPSVSIKPK